MKTLKLIPFILGLLGFNSLFSQEINTVTPETSVGQAQSGSETTEKTYTIYANGKEIRNSIRITTSISQDILLDEKDSDKVEQEQVNTPKKITKTVLIDNDEDDNYDEKIVFSYLAGANSDFTLLSNDDQLLVGVSDGDNLNIVESERITLKHLKSNKEAYVFTNKNGEEIEFYIEDYERLH